MSLVWKPVEMLCVHFSIKVADVYTCTVHLLSSLVPEQLRINRQPLLAEGRTAGSGLWAGTYERWS